MNLGTYGIWWSGNWSTADLSVEDVAGEMERLGYSTLWASGGFSPGIPAIFKRLLDGTADAVVATGITSVWLNEPAEVATAAAELGARFLFGIGASHAPLVEYRGVTYDKPFSKVSSFLDGLDASEPGVPAGRRILAALGDRMLRMAAERAIGAHPYFVPLSHTERARAVLGEGPLLATEVAVVLDADPATARASARDYAALYLGLPNYANNLIRLGFEPADVENGGSDRLIDAVIPWGSPEQVARRITEHRDAGADHVCIQVVHPRSDEFPLASYRELAAALR